MKHSYKFAFQNHVLHMHDCKRIIRMFVTVCRAARNVPFALSLLSIRRPAHDYLFVAMHAHFFCVHQSYLPNNCINLTLCIAMCLRVCNHYNFLLNKLGQFTAGLC